jgi:hypothetical protein
MSCTAIPGPLRDLLATVATRPGITNDVIDVELVEEPVSEE